MWTWIVRVILRQRLAILIFIAFVTAFAGYKAVQTQMSYEMNNLLPENNEHYKKYAEFKQRFGEDGSIIVVGVTNPDIYKLEEFNKWYDLTYSIRNIKGVEEILSISNAMSITKDTVAKRFRISTVVEKKPSTQAQVDSIRQVVESLPFFRGLLYNAENGVYLMAITLKKDLLNDKSRIEVVQEISSKIENYRKLTGYEVHCSGLPFIRTVTMKIIKNELFIFIILSIIIAAIILYLFFRSLKIVAASLVVVIISIIWVLGFISLMGYKITILTGVIPSLLVIIAIENCIYILNKFHHEFLIHGNKIRALSSTIRRIGFASLMTNLATALGFAAFILVNNKMFSEFGLVTSANIMLEYLLTITVFPVFLSYMNPPRSKHTKHLENHFFVWASEKVVLLISNHRRIVFLVSGLILVISFVGLSKMKTSGKIVDDLAKEDPINLDLNYFESNFGGVMPFEIEVDSRKKGGAILIPTIKKVDEMQKLLSVYPQLSKPLSLAEMVKFARQSFYNGDPAQYKVPSEMEKNFILAYIPQEKSKKGNPLKPFIDSTMQITRIGYQVKDLGTKEMKQLLAEIKPGIDSIFSPEKFDVTITGKSVVYARGTDFLIRNLFESVAIAVLLISLLMALMFRSLKMIVVSMVPNLIPLIVTAAIMGFSGIPLKPSTLIVFSIALGISVDNAIQYLARYRHSLKMSNNNITFSAISALKEAFFSMVYTSIVLVLGFSVFMISDFGGTRALGLLISCTLFVAMFFNIVVLPSLLVSLDKFVTTKSFTEDAIIEEFDEEHLTN